MFQSEIIRSTLSDSILFKACEPSLPQKSAIHIARIFLGRKQNFTGQHFLARGYYVNTVGRDENVIREYIRHQEEEDRRQMS